MSTNSSHVDERVVQMEFDNKQFEKNVSQTMTTLDKLKEKLKFDDSAKNFQALERASSGVSFDSLSASLSAVNDRFSTFGIVGMTIIQRLTNAAIDLGNKLLSSVAAPLNQIKTGGWNRALNIEKSMFTMKGLLDDFDEQQDRIKENIDWAVSGTAYSYDAAAMAMSQLVASGVEFREGSDDMKEALRGISGVAAQTNSDYSEIAHIFTSVAGNGRLMGQQLTQLSLRGFNAAAVLGKSLGKTEQEIRDMTSKGQISFQQFAHAMDDAFGEHAKKANDTFTGALSNIKAALSRTGQGFGASLQTYGRDILNSIRPNINKFNKEYLQPLVDDFDAIMAHIADRAKKIFGNGEEGILNLEWTKDAIKTLENLALGLWGILETIGDAFGKIFPAPTVDMVNGFFKNIREESEKFKNNFATVMDFVKPVEEKLGETAETIETVTEAASKLDEIAQKVINGEYGNGEARRKALENLGYSYEEVQNRVNELLGSEKRYTNTKKETEKVDKRLFKMEEDLAAEEKKRQHRTWEYRDSLTKIHTAAKGIADFMGMIRDAASSFVEIIAKPALPVIFETILDVISWIGEKLSYVADKAKEYDTFNKTFQLIVDIFTAANEEIHEFYDWFMSLDSVQRIGESLKELWERIEEAIFNSAENLRSFKEKLDSMPGIQKLGEAFTKLLDVLGQLLDLGLKQIADGLEKILGIDPKNIDVFMSLIDNTAGGLSLFINAILVPGFTTFKNVIDGILSATGYLASKIDWSKVLQFGLFLGQMKILFSIGKIFGGLFEIIKNIGLIPKKIGSILGGISGALNAFQNDLKSQSILRIAGAIGILALSLIALSFIDGDALYKAVAALITISIIMLAVYKSITKSKTEAANATAGVKSLKENLQKFANTLNDGLNSLFKGVAFSAVGLGILAFAAAMLILVRVFKQLNDLKLGESAEAFRNFGVAMLGLISIMAATVGSAILLSKFATEFKVSTGVALVALAASIYILAKALIQVSSLPLDSLKVGLIGAIGAVAALVAAAVILSDAAQKFKPSIAVSLLIFAAAIGVVSKAVITMSALSFEQMIVGLIGVVGLMVSLAGISNIANSKGMLGFAAGAVILAVALNLLAIPLKMLAKTDLKQMAGTAAILAGTLAALAIVGSFSSGLISAGAGMLIMAAAVTVLAVALQLISRIKFESLVKSLGLIAAVFVAIGLMAVVLNKPLMGLALGLLTVSAAALGLSISLMLLGPALTLLIAGIVNFSKGLVENAGTIGLAFLMIITAIAAGIIGGQVAIAAAGSGLISALMGAITASTPAMLLTIGKFIIAALAFASLMLSGVVQKLMELLIQAIRVLADTIVANAEPIFDALWQLFDAIVVFVSKAIVDFFDNTLGDLIPAVHDFCEQANKELDEVYDSRKARRRGSEVTEETAQAIRYGTGEVVDATTDMATQSNDAVVDNYNPSQAIAAENAAVQEEVDNTKNYTVTSMLDTGSGMTKALTSTTDLTGVLGGQNGLGGMKSMLAGALPELGGLSGDLGGGLTDTFGQYFNFSGVVEDEVTNQVPQVLREAAATDKYAYMDYLDYMTDDASANARANARAAGEDITGGLQDGLDSTAIDYSGIDLSGMYNASYDDAYAAGSEAPQAYAQGAIDNAAAVQNAGTEITSMLLEATDTAKTDLQSSGSQGGLAFARGINTMLSRVKTEGTRLKNNAVTGTNGVYDSMYRQGSYAGEGFYDGMGSWADAIADRAYKIVKGAVQAAKDAENSNSPSKETRKLGVYFDQGFILGMQDLSGNVSNAASNVATDALDAMRTAVGKIGAILSTDLDYEPTIRPVMDLSDVEAGAKLINDAIAKSGAFIPVGAVGSTARLAGQFAASDSKLPGSDGINAGNSYVFTQNNYSPKALSRLEIYRQTKNQFAQMKGLTANG